MDLSAIIDRALINPEFRNRLMAESRATLAECGIELPETVEVQVVHGTGQSTILGEVVSLVLPEDEWTGAPSLQEIERSVPEWGMSVCSKSYSCCCGHSDPIEETPPAMAA